MLFVWWLLCRYPSPLLSKILSHLWPTLNPIGGYNYFDETSDPVKVEEQIQNIEGSKISHLQREHNCCTQKFSYSTEASFEYKLCRIIATQKRFISFAGEDLFKRSEKDWVLEYVILLSTYEVMIWVRDGLAPIPKTLIVYFCMLDW